MTKLEQVFNALVKMGYKAKMKDNVVTIRGFRFTVKGESIFTHNHKGELVAYGYYMMNALAPVANKE